MGDQTPAVAADSAPVQRILPNGEDIQYTSTNSIEKRQQRESKPVFEQSRWPIRRKHKKNRFNLDQRAVLDTEVSANGPSPDISRRKELAIKLGVEEIVIRVCIGLVMLVIATDFVRTGFSISVPNVHGRLLTLRTRILLLLLQRFQLLLWNQAKSGHRSRLQRIRESSLKAIIKNNVHAVKKAFEAQDNY